MACLIMTLEPLSAKAAPVGASLKESQAISVIGTGSVEVADPRPSSMPGDG